MMLSYIGCLNLTLPLQRRAKFRARAAQHEAV